MGDIADWITFEAMWDDEYDDDENTPYGSYYNQFCHVCKHCGQKNLGWKKTTGGWRLSNNEGTIHKCLH